MINSVQRLWDNTFQPMLRRIGVDIQRYPPIPQPDWTELAFRKTLPISAVGELPSLTEAEAFLLYCIRHSDESNSQLFQDLFVRWKLGDKQRGFFVEFGATNGVDLSNTYSLEKRLSWAGILAEPARCWHQTLARNRQCAIDMRCVWNRSAEALSFNEVAIPEFSTINKFSAGDSHSASREKGTTYVVNTISLNDLLAEHKAPNVMDYLSIDTEGSEFTILENFDFNKYMFGIITVEHNYTSERGLIKKLLNKHGYKRVFTQFSRWDDWYVHELCGAT